MKGSEPVTLKLRLSGYKFRSPSLPVRTRFDSISSRINNPDTASKIRSSNVIAGDRDRRGWDTDIHAVSATRLRGGMIVPYDSVPWESTEFGNECLDLQIAGFRLPTEQGKRMSQATLIKLVTERVAGRASALPRHRNYNSFVIDILSGAFPIIPNQTDLRNRELISLYTSINNLDVVFSNKGIKIPQVDGGALIKILTSGGFYEQGDRDAFTQIQRFAIAMAMLTDFEKDILCSLHGINGMTIETPKEIAARYGYNRGSSIRHFEIEIFNFFNEINTQRESSIGGIIPDRAKKMSSMDETDISDWHRVDSNWNPFFWGEL